MKVTRTERGWGGHFINNDRCTFRRNTLLETKNAAIVVSTVGNYINSETGKLEEIGFNRDYETMAFYVDLETGEYKDADGSRKIYFESPWAYKIKKRRDIC